MEYKRIPIEGYNGEYEIDNHGVIYSVKSGKVLKQTDYGSKYLQVSLCKDGRRKVVNVHRLVATAFIPNPDNLPQVNHKDENKHNNNVENLEWCTAKYNINYGTVKERVAKTKREHPYSPSQEQRLLLSIKAKEYWATHKHPLRKLKVLCLDDGEIYTSYSEAGSAYGIPRKAVRDICLRPDIVRRKYNRRFALIS